MRDESLPIVGLQELGSALCASCIVNIHITLPFLLRLLVERGVLCSASVLDHLSVSLLEWL